jgi:hypothetical protein
MAKPAYKLNSKTCDKEHTGKVPMRRIADLPESQAGAWRHRCAACAYQMGFEDAIRAVKGRIAREKMEALKPKAVHVHPDTTN